LVLDIIDSIGLVGWMRKELPTSECLNLEDGCLACHMKSELNPRFKRLWYEETYDIMNLKCEGFGGENLDNIG